MDEEQRHEFLRVYGHTLRQHRLLDKQKARKANLPLWRREKKAHSKVRRIPSSGWRTHNADIDNNEAALGRMREDYARYEAVVRRDKDGIPVNNLTIDTLQPH